MACVDIPALPLQMLLRTHPDWAGLPVVVVDKEKSLGVVQWVNEHARACRILPGMRYAAGLSLSRDLRGGTVSEDEIQDTVRRLTRRLWDFSPRIEPSPLDPGLFWLDASGLGRLYPSLDTWADTIRGGLQDAGFRAVAAVGFSRFGSYAAARAATSNVVFQTPEQERAHVRRVPIERLRLDPRFRDTLLKLGIETLGAFIDLPGEGIRKRFGRAAEELHTMARGEGWSPLQPEHLFEALEHTTDFDWPEHRVESLLAAIAVELHRLMPELKARYQTVKALVFALRLDNGDTLREEVKPAEPTRDATQILSLARLRLETLSLSSGVVELTVRIDGVKISEQQLDLLRTAPQRNLDAAQRAFAEIRAELGRDAVLHARLHERHLPEASYRLEALGKLGTPRPAETTGRSLVRRVYTPATELPPCKRHEPDGWLIAGVSEGPVEEVVGPQLVCGGWWMREASRAYHYVRTRSGRWLWIYYDHKRRRWYLQGEVQ